MVYIIHINQKDVIKINICRLIFKEITNNCYFCCFPLSGEKIFVVPLFRLFGRIEHYLLKGFRHLLQDENNQH